MAQTIPYSDNPEQPRGQKNVLAYANEYYILIVFTATPEHKYTFSPSSMHRYITILLLSFNERIDDKHKEFIRISTFKEFHHTRTNIMYLSALMNSPHNKLRFCSHQ